MERLSSSLSTLLFKIGPLRFHSVTLPENMKQSFTEKTNQVRDKIEEREAHQVTMPLPLWSLAKSIDIQVLVIISRILHQIDAIVSSI